MKSINDWENISGKIKNLKKKREHLYEKLEATKDFNEFIKLSDEINCLSYHIEVIRNLTKAYCPERELATKTNNYASHSTK